MTALDAVATTLELHGDVRRDEPLARHTTFGVGGPADIFLTVRNADALAAATNAARDADVPLFVLGSGSNILVADAGIRGVTVDNRARAEQPDSTGLTYRIESGM
ncbi:MAG: FAD-binding protein, partial [Tepidiformaceae bacterium]